MAPTRPILGSALLLLAGCTWTPLDEAVTQDALVAHLAALQQIADDDGGNRAAFTAGYADSVAYVAGQLQAAGYDVQIEPFTVELPTIRDAALSQVAPQSVDYAYEPAQGKGFSVWLGSPAIDLVAPVVAVDLVLPPGDSPDTSTSGCEASDYDGFPAGAIALVQRGTCPFGTKEQVAAGAGAAAVLLFNEGQPGRTARIDGTFMLTDPPAIPFFSLDYRTGAALAPAAEAGTLRMHLVADVTVAQVTDDNVVADTPIGDPERTVLVGAHLDSDPAGPGINDNGSGVALVLELARQVAQTGFRPRNRIRFAFWGAGELGFAGSGLYVQAHGIGEWAAFNYDTVASPNGIPFVYSGGVYGYTAPTGADMVERAVDEWYRYHGLPFGLIGANRSSDSWWWATGGVPTGGIYTGGPELLPPQMAAATRGDAGQPMDACYQQACDVLDHVDQRQLLHSAQAAGYALKKMARWGGPLQ